MSFTLSPGTSTAVRASAFSCTPLSAATFVSVRASAACRGVTRYSITFRWPGISVPTAHSHWLSSALVRLAPAVRASTCADRSTFSTTRTFSAGTLPVFSTSTRTVNGSSRRVCFGAVLPTFTRGALIRVVTCSPCSNRT